MTRYRKPPGNSFQQSRVPQTRPLFCFLKNKDSKNRLVIESNDRDLDCCRHRHQNRCHRCREEDHNDMDNNNNGGERLIEFTQTPAIEDGTFNWWGEPSPDMKPLDSRSLVFNSKKIKRGFQIMGQPLVHLRITSDQPVFNIVVRLEDVAENGQISFITGALIHSTNYKNEDERINPVNFPINTPTDVEIKMHYTTWTFRKCHRVRLSISMIEYPLVWAQPVISNLTIDLSAKHSFLNLPLPNEALIPQRMPPPEYIATRPGVITIAGVDLTPFKVIHLNGRDVAVAVESSDWIVINEANTSFHLKRYNTISYYIDTTNPAICEFIADGVYSVVINENTPSSREVKVTSYIDVKSDATNFYAQVQRKLFENGVMVGEISFPSLGYETIPRDFQ